MQKLIDSDDTLTLRSRGDEKVRVTDPRNRAFLEQADALVVQMNEKMAAKSEQSSFRRLWCRARQSSITSYSPPPVA